MRRIVAIIGLFVMTGCGSNSATPSATPSVPALPGETVTSRQTAPQAGTHRPAGTHVTINPSYSAFVTRICRDFTARNATDITSQLPYFQYNSGLRYGQMGDGEGQTGDISLMATWLRRATVRCVQYTQSVAGHGVLLTSGWSQPGGWALLDMDTYSGSWKINDITFGQRNDVLYAIHVANPILQYRG